MPEQVVWKYPVPLEGNGKLTLHLPEHTELLTVQMQHGSPRLWVLVHDKVATTEARHFQWVGTGHVNEFRVTPTYVGTVQLDGGLFVFHLFEVVE